MPYFVVPFSIELSIKSTTRRVLSYGEKSSPYDCHLLFMVLTDISVENGTTNWKMFASFRPILQAKISEKNQQKLPRTRAQACKLKKVNRYFLSLDY